MWGGNQQQWQAQGDVAGVDSQGVAAPSVPSPALDRYPVGEVQMVWSPQQVGSHAEGDDLRVLGKRRRGPGGLPHAKWQRLSLYGAARQAGGSASGTATDALLLAARLFGDAVADAISQRQQSQRQAHAQGTRGQRLPKRGRRGGASAAAWRARRQAADTPHPISYQPPRHLCTGGFPPLSPYAITLPLAQSAIIPPLALCATYPPIAPSATTLP